MLVEMSDTTATTAKIALQALGGAHAPAGLAADLAALLTLPEHAREHLWEILGPSLADPVPAQVEAEVERFCVTYDVEREQLGYTIRACRFLLREAASIDLSRAAFAADLEALSSEAEAIGALLLPRFESAKAFVRREMLRNTIADHGKLLESVTWRVDHPASSSRGKRLAGRVVSLTLGYREGDRRERVTLQVLPEALVELKKLCDQLLS
jgi:hypothetical protein